MSELLAARVVEARSRLAQILQKMPSTTAAIYVGRGYTINDLRDDLLALRDEVLKVATR